MDNFIYIQRQQFAVSNEDVAGNHHVSDIRSLGCINYMRLRVIHWNHVGAANFDNNKVRLFTSF